MFAPFMQPETTLSPSQKHALDNVQEADESNHQAGATRILYKSVLSIHTVNYIRTDKAVQMKSKFQHAGA
jgi:hypothetical protein